MITLLVVALSGYLIFRHWTYGAEPAIWLAWAWLSGLNVLALRPRRWNRPIDDPCPTCEGHHHEHWRVVVMTSYRNEDPGLLDRCLHSITHQTRMPDVVWVVEGDDQSGECAEIVRNHREAGRCPIKFAIERGSIKRDAHAYVVRWEQEHVQEQAFVYISVDSDTELCDSSIEEILRPFADARVGTVSSNIVGLNHDTNTLTKAVDIIHVVSNTLWRSAMGRLGVITSAEGVFCAFRGTIVRKWLDNYVEDYFAGKRVVIGDDAFLTRRSIEDGYLSVFQPTAYALTADPENISHLFRQRLRWGISLWQGAYRIFQRFPVTSTMWWAAFFQFNVLISFLLFVGWVAVVGGAQAFILLFAWTVPATYLQTVSYLRRPLMPMWLKVWRWLWLTPVTCFLGFFVLLPANLVGLLLVRRGTAWRTRANVEVRDHT